MERSRWSVPLVILAGVAGVTVSTRELDALEIPDGGLTHLPDGGSAIRLLPLLADGGAPQFNTANPLEFARYRGRLPEAIGDSSIVGGVPMHLGQMTVAEAPSAVRDYYRNQFKKMGMISGESTMQDKSGAMSITSIDPRTKQMALITMRAQGRGTMIIASYATVDKIKPRPPIPPDFPLPMGADHPLYDEIYDNNVRQRDISFVVVSKAEDVLSFYDSKLTEQGFHRSRDVIGVPSGPGAGTFSRGREEIVIKAKTLNEDKTRVRVTAIWIQK
jgi:hypothetical protein